MTLTEHLSELRMRIIRSMLAVAIGAVVILIFYDFVLEFISAPYQNTCKANSTFTCDGSLFTMGPTEGLTTRMRIAGYGGLISALPVVLWQVWRFVVPALSSKERKYSIPFILTSTTLFLLGMAMAYWTLGRALDFLIAWSGQDVKQVFSISKYVSLVAMMMLAFGIGFLAPVLMVFLQLVGVVTPQVLLRQWRVAIMVLFALAAVITPSGDPISMMALAVPMTVLYLVAVLVGLLVQRRRRSRESVDSSM